MTSCNPTPGLPGSMAFLRSRILGTVGLSLISFPTMNSSLESNRLAYQIPGAASTWPEYAVTRCSSEVMLATIFYPEDIGNGSLICELWTSTYVDWHLNLSVTQMRLLCANYITFIVQF